MSSPSNFNSSNKRIRTVDAPNESTSITSGQVSTGSPLLQTPPFVINTLPISALSPFSGNKWDIVARVTYKSDIVSYKNGSGKLFSIHLLDASNSEIRCNFYSDSCDKYYDQIEYNKVYRLSRGKVRDVIDKRYTSITNSYDLTFDGNSYISEEVDNGEIKQYALNLTKIEKLSCIDPNRIVDIMGIVKSVSEIQTFQTQLKTSQKRDMEIFDDSGAEVRLTLWDNFALIDNEDLYQKHLIVAMKNVKVSEFMGRSLSTTVTSSMIFNPIEGQFLRTWLLENTGNDDANSNRKMLTERPGSQLKYSVELESRQSIKFIRDNRLGQREEGDIVSLKVSITHVNHDRRPWYDACPSKGCNKKVTKESEMYHCMKCNRDFGECVQRYILSCVCSDYSGQLTMTFYNDQAEKLLGVAANQLNYYLENGNVVEYEKCFSNVLFRSFAMSVKLKSRILNDDYVLESSVLYLEEICWRSEGAQLLEQLMKLSNDGEV